MERAPATDGGAAAIVLTPPPLLSRTGLAACRMWRAPMASPLESVITSLEHEQNPTALNKSVALCLVYVFLT